MIQSRLFLLRDNKLCTRCTFRFKTLQDVFIHLELLHDAWNVIKKNHNRGTLIMESKCVECYNLFVRVIFQPKKEKKSQNMFSMKLLLPKFFCIAVLA